MLKQYLIFFFLFISKIYSLKNSINALSNNMSNYNPYADPIVPYCIFGSSPICSTNNNTFINKCVMHLLGEKYKKDGWCDEVQKKKKTPKKKRQKNKNKRLPKSRRNKQRRPQMQNLQQKL